jgi:hypothetical protein
MRSIDMLMAEGRADVRPPGSTSLEAVREVRRRRRSSKDRDDPQRTLRLLIDAITAKLENIESGQRFRAKVELHEAERALHDAQKRHARAKAIYDNVQRQLAPQRRKARRA